MQPNVAFAIEALGGPTEVARRAGVTAWAVSKWRLRLPPQRVLWLAEQTEWHWTPHQLAPHLYPGPTDGLPERARATSGLKPGAAKIIDARRTDGAGRDRD